MTTTGYRTYLLASAIGALVLALVALGVFRAKSAVIEKRPADQNLSLEKPCTEPATRSRTGVDAVGTGPGPDAPPTNAGTKPSTGNAPTESVPPEVIERYGDVFRKAHPRSELPEGWRERILKNSKWDADTHCWTSGYFGIEWPSLVLKDFGGPKSNNMPKRIATDRLASWLEEEEREGRAISVSQAETIAEEFAKRFVPDWAERNYRIAKSGWETAGPSVGGSNEVSHGWYSVNFVQAPIESAGEVIVTRSPILVCVDPWTSEVLWYARNIEGRKRIEPRFAFCDPLLREQRARELWETKLETAGFFLSPEATAEFEVLGAPTFVLMVEVTWDEFAVASGRPIWDIEFQLRRIDRDPDPEGRTSRVRVFGRMKIDARSGETVQFSTRN